MFTYQVRQRKFVHEKEKRLIFPGEVEIVFQLGPLHLFGCGEPGGSTFTKGAKREFRPDSHRGRISLISPSGLKPLKVFLEGPRCRIEMNGNNLHIHEHCQSSLKLEARIQNIFFSIPILLNIEFFDPQLLKKFPVECGM